MEYFYECYWFFFLVLLQSLVFTVYERVFHKTESKKKTKTLTWMWNAANNCHCRAKRARRGWPAASKTSYVNKFFVYRASGAVDLQDKRRRGNKLTYVIH